MSKKIAPPKRQSHDAETPNPKTHDTRERLRSIRSNSTIIEVDIDRSRAIVSQDFETTVPEASVAQW